MRKVILTIGSLKLVLLFTNLPSKWLFRSKVGKRCFVHSRFADVFQVVISVGIVLISGRAKVQVSGSPLNSSWSNLPFALNKPFPAVSDWKPYTSSITLLNCCLVWLCAIKRCPCLTPVVGELKPSAECYYMSSVGGLRTVFTFLFLPHRAAGRWARSASQLRCPPKLYVFQLCASVCNQLHHSASQAGSSSSPSQAALLHLEFLLPELA